ncbi:hypothetical protein N8E89_20115 (plasmid) [Phyllobacterium sp. A18/5-2]|uniref:hypothetical protein n=1 Tax=Phyllobacterium sp. A18/5-2 TaxID=2978392 RepID=UPI0021C64169|nr:hypothetical protein [Phyllobacterium sp. A18/5-2]UXN66884.1 hypothetical protein N8E89_20115 [Phyllobacterium sp. A18/5-2]
MANLSVYNVASQAGNAAPSPSAPQQQFEAAISQAVTNGGSSLMAQEMMKVANEMLNEAMSEDE